MIIFRLDLVVSGVFSVLLQHYQTLNVLQIYKLHLQLFSSMKKKHKLRKLQVPGLCLLNVCLRYIMASSLRSPSYSAQTIRLRRAITVFAPLPLPTQYSGAQITTTI